MGKLIFTPLQKIVFEELSKEKELRDNFYFGGGTALSVFYLQHRFSDDLDFFCKKDLDKDLLIKFMNRVASNLGITSKVTKKQMILWFELAKGKESLKVDFISFPYPQIEKCIIYKGVNVDSPKDIGANKLLTLNLETNPKDYVDLYFLLKEKFTIWDLIYAVEAKFKLELDLISLGEDFLEVDRIDFLPRMIKPLNLDELKMFFRGEAAKLGKKVI